MEAAGGAAEAPAAAPPRRSRPPPARPPPCLSNVVHLCALEKIMTSNFAPYPFLSLIHLRREHIKGEFHVAVNNLQNFQSPIFVKAHHG